MNYVVFKLHQKQPSVRLGSLFILPKYTDNAQYTVSTCRQGCASCHRPARTAEGCQTQGHPLVGRERATFPIAKTKTMDRETFPSSLSHHRGRRAHDANGTQASHLC